MCEERGWLFGAMLLAMGWMYAVAWATTGRLTARFDEEARRRRYFQEAAEATMGRGWYPFRRASLYLLAIGSKWIARRRFPGVDFRKDTPRWFVALAVIQVLLFAALLTASVPAVWVRFSCR